MNQQTQDIYNKVTQQIIEAMERGAGSYRMPWHVTGAECFAPVNVVSKRPYRGINVLLLWLLAEHHGYTSGEWATYNQWQEFGAQVRKGEKAALIVFWKISERSREVADDQEEPTRNRSILARGYHVFNAAQGRAAIAALQTHDLVCAHIEAPDEASHEGRADAKVNALEEIDRHIVGPLLEALPAHGDWRILVSPDHRTPVRTRTHAHGAVPFALAGTGIAAKGQPSYDDAVAEASDWAFDRGHELMQRFLA